MPQGHGLARMRPSSRRPQPPARCGAHGVWTVLGAIIAGMLIPFTYMSSIPLFGHLHDRQVPSRGADSCTALPSTMPRPVNCHHHALADVIGSHWKPPVALLLHQLHMPTCQRQGKHWRCCVGRPTHVKDAAAFKHCPLLQPPPLLLVGMLLADREQEQPAENMCTSADLALRLSCFLRNGQHAHSDGRTPAMPLFAGLIKFIGSDSQMFLAAWLGTPLCAVSIQVEGPFLMQDRHDAPP